MILFQLTRPTLCKLRQDFSLFSDTRDDIFGECRINLSERENEKLKIHFSACLGFEGELRMEKLEFNVQKFFGGEKFRLSKYSDSDISRFFCGFLFIMAN